MKRKSSFVQLNFTKINLGLLDFVVLIIKTPGNSEIRELDIFVVLVLYQLSVQRGGIHLCILVYSPVLLGFSDLLVCSLESMH